MSFTGAMTSTHATPSDAATPGAVTVSIYRRVATDRIPEATAWVQSGVNLANRYPGFLGSGWVRDGEDSCDWHMLYRFADEESLDRWEASRERQWWLASGSEFVQEERAVRRTGIEGWFDEPAASQADRDGHAVTETVAVPPRWKQAVSIWLGFFPVNLVFTLLMAWLVPAFGDLNPALRVLITTLVLTPIMTFWVLPFVTYRLRRWLAR